MISNDELFEEVKNRFDDLNTRFMNMGIRMGSFETKLESLNTRIGNIEEQNKSNFEAQMEILESSVKNAGDVITSLQHHDAQIKTLKTSLENTNTVIANIQEQTMTNCRKLDELQKAIESLKENK